MGNPQGYAQELLNMFWRRPRESLEQLRLEACEKALKRLIDDVEELDDKYTRLRGLVYARKLHKDPAQDTQKPQEPTSPDPTRMSRQELKAFLTRSGRFTPGQPPKHSE